MLLNQTQALKRRILKVEKKRGEMKKRTINLIILKRDSQEVDFVIKMIV